MSILNEQVVAKQTFRKNANAQSEGGAQDRPKNLKQLKNKSFVVSCGGGCAMTYTATAVKQDVSCFKVKFKVEMYVNEDLTDTYTENYSFIYDSLHNIEKILDTGNKNVLKTLPLGARKSFVAFGHDLIKTYMPVAYRK